MSTKLELNIRSLIAHCEELVKDDTNNWILKKYVKSLDTMIQELESSNEKTNSKLIDEYYSRCAKIKKTINYVENPAGVAGASTTNKLKSKLKDVNASSDTIIKEINQMHNTKYNNEIRKDLLGTEGIRKRDMTGFNKDDLGQAMKHYSDMQEKLAEDMLALTRNLKEQTETANRIIKKDTELVTASTKLSDRNFSSLTNEADKLQEHSKRAWKCWMWIMIALVMMIFIVMVLFMKIMKKKVVT